MLALSTLKNRASLLESWGLILRGLFIITAVCDSLVISALFLYFNQAIQTGYVVFMSDFGMPYEVSFIFPFLFVLNGLLVAWALYSLVNYARVNLKK